jgi:uncharacterized protein YndB with AHSA1/START domain
MGSADMKNENSMTHGTLSWSRFIRAPRERVFDAWTQLQHRRQWFRGPDGWVDVRRSLDLREGGTELAHGRFESGIESIYLARFHHIEPGARLIYAFDMTVDGKLFSVSLAGVSFDERGEGTELVYTEHMFSLVAGYGADERAAGTEALLERFISYVEQMSGD